MKKRTGPQKKISGKNKSGKTLRKSSADRLTYDEIEEIISLASNSLPLEVPVGEGVTLGCVFPAFKHRQIFRRNVYRIVGSRGFKIQLNKIPIEPHFTFNRISRAVSILAVPGDTTTSYPI
jgi:hypothetical protein